MNMLPGLSGIFLSAFFIMGIGGGMIQGGNLYADTNNRIVLPLPENAGDAFFDRLLDQRRSVRHFADTPLALLEISRILRAAQGVTNPRGLRTAPSAGGLFPMEIFLAAGRVEGLAPGVYQYQPREHRLVRRSRGDPRQGLHRAAFSQSSVKTAAAVIVIAAVYERVTGKYGDRGIRYVHMESGHVAQNIYLQAADLNLGTVAIGAFDDNRVQSIMGMAANEKPLYIMPVGGLR